MRRPSPSMAVAVTALVAALGGVAVASPIGGDGKVHLCYSQEGVDVNDGNQVVAVNAGSPCPSEYPQSLVLNRTGPAGVPGPTGIPGPQGPVGAPKPLPKPVSKEAIDELKKSDKLADKNRDKLRDLADKLKQMNGKNVDAETLRLMQQQRRMAEIMRQIADAMSQMAAANRKVIQNID
jgi:hypothetical protein